MAETNDRELEQFAIIIIGTIIAAACLHCCPPRSRRSATEEHNTTSFVVGGLDPSRRATIAIVARYHRTYYLSAQQYK